MFHLCFSDPSQCRSMNDISVTPSNDQVQQLSISFPNIVIFFSHEHIEIHGKCIHSLAQSKQDETKALHQEPWLISENLCNGGETYDP